MLHNVSISIQRLMQLDFLRQTKLLTIKLNKLLVT